MVISCIRKLFFISLMVAFAWSGKAQQAHFVYLQTDDGQPFYVKINNKLISSSSEGYVILPDIKDGDYQLVVGFPKKKFPEENFNLSIDKKNAGFLIKNLGEKGWQLFNLQTLALIESTNENSIAKEESKEVDPFSAMLANVVKDSSILQDHTVAKAPVKTLDTLAVDINKPNTQSDTLSSIVPESTAVPESPVVSESPVVTESPTVTESPVVTEPSVVAKPSAVTEQKPMISMILNKEDQDGLQRIYEDRNEGSDTITIFFPAGKTTQPIAANQDSDKNIAKNIMPDATPPVENNNPGFTITPTIIPDTDTGKDSTVSTGNENNNPINPDSLNDTPSKNQNTRGSEGQEAKIVLLPKEVTSSKVNSDCKAFATTEDFLRLRKKMASENNPEDMIKVAKKYFKVKCYGTEQIKDLSYLFLTDKGKYMFFDAAYPFTSDSDKYQTLQSQLTDEYYLNRFKAMIRK